MFQQLRKLLLGPPGPPRLEEERYPRDSMGRPDLTRFVRSAEHYAGYIDEYLSTLRPSSADAEPRSTEWLRYAYRKGVLGEWGLIARGPSESLPFVVRLLRDLLPEARQKAAGILDAWVSADGNHSTIEEHALAAAEREAALDEPDVEALSGFVGILGRTRSQRALPLLARLLRMPSASIGDLDWATADAIAETVGKAFDRSGDRREAAERWLRSHGL